MLAVSKKQVSWRIRIGSVNQILRNKEKVKQIRNVNILTRITYRRILCVYSCFTNNKQRGPVPHCPLLHNDNRKYFSGLSLIRNRREAHVIHLAREVGEISRCSCWEEGNFIMIYEFRYGQTWKIWPSSRSLTPYNPFNLFCLIDKTA